MVALAFNRVMALLSCQCDSIWNEWHCKMGGHTWDPDLETERHRLWSWSRGKVVMKISGQEGFIPLSQGDRGKQSAAFRAVSLKKSKFCEQFIFSCGSTQLWSWSYLPSPGRLHKDQWERRVLSCLLACTYLPAHLLEPTSSGFHLIHKTSWNPQLCGTEQQLSSWPSHSQLPIVELVLMVLSVCLQCQLWQRIFCWGTQGNGCLPEGRHGWKDLFLKQTLVKRCFDRADTGKDLWCLGIIQTVGDEHWAVVCLAPSHCCLPRTHKYLFALHSLIELFLVVLLPLIQIHPRRATEFPVSTFCFCELSSGPLACLAVSSGLMESVSDWSLVCTWVQDWTDVAGSLVVSACLEDCFAAAECY